MARVLGKSIDMINDCPCVFGFGRATAIKQNIELGKVSHNLAYSKDGKEGSIDDDGQSN